MSRTRRFALLAASNLALLVGGLGACKSDPRPGENADISHAGNGGTQGNAAGSPSAGSIEPATGGAAAASSTDAGAAGTLSTSGGAAALGGSENTQAGNGGASNTGGSAAVTGAECQSNTNCLAVDICVAASGAHVSTCRPRCSTTEVGTTAACSAGEICTYDQSERLASCQRICDPFDPTIAACPSPDGCYVAPASALTEGTPTSGLCVRVGPLVEGEACLPGECGGTLECLATQDSGGAAWCAPWCDPAAGSSDPGACADDEACETGLDGRTACVKRCTPLVDAECASDEVCRPMSKVDGATVPSGRCIVPGTLQLGDDCSPGACDRDLVCGNTPSPFASASLRCVETCTTDGSGTCTSGECIPLGVATSDFGTCSATCTLLSAGTDAGCQPNEWCAPSYTLAGVGVCVPASGEVATGADCSTTDECIAGAYCECRFSVDAFCDTSATCEPICIPAATANEPGGCPDGQSCAIESNAGVRFNFGICRTICDSLATASGCGTTETCVDAALSGGGSDVCLDVPVPLVTIGADCPAPTFNIGEICGPTSLCVQWNDLEIARCSEICHLDRGELGADAHPDCTEPAAICTQIPGEAAFGYCRL